MSRISKLGIAAAIAFAAAGSQAQTIETDYPRAVPAGPVVAAVAPVESVTGEVAHGSNAPYLIQSNNEGPRIDPAYAAANATTLTRQQVQSRATVHIGWNAPDHRS